MKSSYVSLVVIMIASLVIISGCSKTGRGLDKMLDQGKYDEVIEIAKKQIEINPEDYALYIVLGDAYYLKAHKFNSDKGVYFSPEAAALGKKAIDYYTQSRDLHESMRIDQKIAKAGKLTYRL